MNQSTCESCPFCNWNAKGLTFAVTADQFYCWMMQTAMPKDFAYTLSYICKWRRLQKQAENDRDIVAANKAMADPKFIPWEDAKKELEGEHD